MLDVIVAADESALLGAEAGGTRHVGDPGVCRGAQIVDINMGCPAKKVCKRLAGSALLEDESLVCRIVEAEKLMETAMETARVMASKNQMGLRLTKESFNMNLNAPSLESAMEMENRAQTMRIFSPEFAEIKAKFIKEKS